VGEGQGEGHKLKLEMEQKRNPRIKPGVSSLLV